MPDKLSVDTEALAQSATKVTGHGDDVVANHADAQRRISAASPGWQGKSAQALNVRAAEWGTVTEKVHGKITDHATGMNHGAAAFDENERNRAGEMDSVSRAARDV
jgi:WXG100 family type VII secretion target